MTTQSLCSRPLSFLRTVVAFLAAGVFFATATFAADSVPLPRIAVVRISKAVADSRAAKQLDQTFQAKLADVRAQIARKQEVRNLLVKRFQEVQADFTKATDAKDDAAARAAREKSEPIAASVQDADREIAALNNDQVLGAWLRGEQAKLAELVNNAIRTVGQRHGCQLVLDATLVTGVGFNAVSIVDPAHKQSPIDLTDEVVGEMNLTVIDNAAPSASR